jgi:hypothetical protein
MESTKQVRACLIERQVLRWLNDVRLLMVNNHIEML